MKILTVCTGNICRSPLAEVVLRTHLADTGVAVESAGTQGLSAAPMTSKAQRLAVEAGVPAELANAHSSRYLTEQMLAQADLVLALTRDHRTHILSMRPALMKRTFTVREFSRIASSFTDEQLAQIASRSDDPSDKLLAVLSTMASSRGLHRATNVADDDVIDPYRRDWDVYQRSADQMLPSLQQVLRVVSIITKR